MFDALGINLPGLVTQLVSFTILLVVLVKLLYGPVLKVLDERSQKIKESLEAADRARSEADSATEKVEQTLADARGQGQRFIADAREAAARYREDQERDAREKAEAFIERARTEIDRERIAAVEEVRKEFAGLAIDAAERIVGKSLDAGTHEGLIESVLSEGLESRKN
jgi:F-type H+-transporting ATPase subunit b